MVQTRRAAPRTGVALTALTALIFVLAVGAALYYEFGGPIPYYVTFSGPAGTPFEGRYALVDSAGAGLPEGATWHRSRTPWLGWPRWCSRAGCWTDVTPCWHRTSTHR